MSWRKICQMAAWNLDQNLRQFLQDEIFPEWAELQCLFQALLQDDAALQELRSRGPESFGLSQWKATFAYLSLNENPARIDFTYADIGVLLVIRSGRWQHDATYLDFAQRFFALQKQKRWLLGWARDPEEKIASEFLKEVRNLQSTGKKFSPHFDLPTNLVDSKVRAA